MIHRLVAALALVATGISVPAATAPAHAARWADGPCTDNVGITIVIDFQELGGGVNVRCAEGPVTSGLDALDKAGIVWEGTRRFPSFVCRIAGKPGPGDESCSSTPPATAYWSYWLAPRGGAWCYSSFGAGSRTPPPGTIEGWSFALDRVAVDVPAPRFDPPAPIPGEAPNPLRGADCGSPASASPSPPTPAPTVPPPAPTTAAASPAAPTTPAVLAEPDSASTAVDDSQQASAGPTATTIAAQAAVNGAVSTSTSIAASAGTSSTIAPTTTRPTSSTGAIELASSASTDTATSSNGSVPLGTVDLSDDGRGDKGFSPAAGLGLLIAGAVGCTSVWIAKRRRRIGPP